MSLTRGGACGRKGEGEVEGKVQEQGAQESDGLRIIYREGDCGGLVKLSRSRRRGVKQQQREGHRGREPSAQGEARGAEVNSNSLPTTLHHSSLLPLLLLLLFHGFRTARQLGRPLPRGRIGPIAHQQSSQKREKSGGVGPSGAISRIQSQKKVR